MPIFLYRCMECGKKSEAYRKIENRLDCPKCSCGGETEKLLTPAMVIKPFEPYRTVAHDKEANKPFLIKTRAEHKAFLARNGYEEVGNDRSCAPKSDEELKEIRARQKDSPDAPMVDVEKLKREGFIQEDLTA